MPDKPKSSSPLGIAGGIVGAAGGWAFSEYCGSSIWIPGAVCVALLLLFAKTSLKPTRFAGAIAITGGHVVWFAVGAAVSKTVAAVGLDIVFLTAGIIWLWLRPGLGASIYLGIIQALSLALNLFSLSGVAFGSTTHRALVAHVVFRSLALAALGVGFWSLKKKGPNQSQHNAGSRPSSIDSPASETPSALGPRG
jgi:hypothetical protein